MNMMYKKIATYMLILVASNSLVHAASWRSWFGLGEAAPTETDGLLATAVAKGDYDAARDALHHGANPNAKLDGKTSILIQAFEAAFNRNEDHRIVSLTNDDRPALVHLLLANGGNKQDLQNYVRTIYIIRGLPMYHYFKENIYTNKNLAFDTFKRFITELGIAGQ